MKLLIVSKGKYAKQGMTLIEIMVVVAVIGALVAINLILDSSAFRRESLSSEESTLVSIISKARSRAMNNIEHKEHGVHIEADKFVIFQSPYDPDEESNEEIERNENITITGSEDLLDGDDEIEVTFLQLSGEPTVVGEISLYDGVDTKTITIKEGGLIDW